MKRRDLLCLSLLLGCAHARPGSLVSSMTTLGPRFVVVAAEEPMVASGGADVLCLACPEGWTAASPAAACVPPGGSPVVLNAALATAEDDAEQLRLELPVASERRVGEARYLCLGPRAPPRKGARYTRAIVHAAEPVRVAEILWISGPVVR